MAYKFLKEVTPFAISMYGEADVKIGGFYINLKSLKGDDKSISFSEDGERYVTFLFYHKGIEYFPEGRKVIFSDGMTSKEKQSLYSKVRNFVKRNIKTKNFYTEKVKTVPPAKLVFIKNNFTDPIGTISVGNRDVALFRTYYYDDYIELTILHEPAVDPFRFLEGYVNSSKFKPMPELAPFVTAHITQTATLKLGLRLGDLKWEFKEKASKYNAITISLNSSKYMIFDYKENCVYFAEGMTPQEKQSLYSKVKNFVRKNYVVLSKKEYKIDRFCVFCDREPRFIIRNKRKYAVAFALEKNDSYHILHDSNVDIMHFVEERREHVIGDDFEIVDNMTNTDDNNHGGDSIANEVEGGDSRDNGITDSNDNSAVPASDTAEDASGDSSTDGFQKEGGESGGDSTSGENGIDTILDMQESSLSDGENHPQATPNPDETAGSQEGDATSTQGGEGNYMDAVVESSTQETCGEGRTPLLLKEDDIEDIKEDNTKNIIDEFLEANEFKPAGRRDYNSSYVNRAGKDIDATGIELNSTYLKKLNAVFKKHLTVSALGRETPTLDKKLLIKRLVSFQSPYTAFKKDLANQTILLLIDTSGSMMNFQPLIPYFWKLTKQINDIVLIENTNMMPYAVYENGRRNLDVDVESDEEAVEFYKSFLRKHETTTIVNFTDFDGVEITEMLLKKTNAEMIIMDVYSCNALDYVPFKDEDFKNLPKPLQPYKRRISYWYGVGDFAEVVWVLNKEL